MTGRIESRLKELGIELPPAGSAAGNYLPHARGGSLVWTARGPTRAGKRLHFGKVGRDISIEEGREAARLTALNLVAEVRAACHGDLDRVIRVVRLAGYVNCAPDFEQLTHVLDAASELLIAVFGDRGPHTRLAVGCATLPGNIAIELEGIFEVA